MGIVTNVALDNNVTDFSLAPIGAHISGIDISSVVTLTKPTGAHAIVLQSSDQNVRYTLDGTTNPTATVGFLAVADVPPVLIPVTGPSFKVIQVAPTANLQGQWVS